MITSFFKPNSKKVKPVATTLSSAEKRERGTKSNGDEIPLAKRLKPSEPSEEVQEILSALDCLKNSTNKTWYDVIEKHASSHSFKQLAKFVSKERKSKTIFPPPRHVLSALNLTPLDKVRVVIVGQDPYRKFVVFFS
jgi:hypothetical protein